MKIINKDFNFSPRQFKRARMHAYYMNGMFRNKDISGGKGLIAITFIGLFLSVSIFSLSPLNASNSNELTSFPTMASYWDLTGTSILINGTETGDDAHNWTWAKSQPWCSGEGTVAQPYIIESITINGQNTSIPFYITNSDQYVEIRNCTFLNCTPATGAAGIRLVNVTNVKILNCTTSFNLKKPGIYAVSCLNITVSNITTIESYSGIRFENCSSSTVSNNTLLNNRYYGISLGSNCSFCLVTNNIISAPLYTSCYGILISSTNNTIITENTFNNGATGIDIGSSSHLVVSHNKIENAVPWGIYIDGRNVNNTFSNNEIMNCVTGLEVYTSSSNNYANFQENYTITGNYIRNCSAQGLDLFWRNSNFTILNNTIFDTNVGIFFYGCNNSILANNSITNANKGIDIDGNCQNTVITNNSMFGGGIEMPILPNYAYDIRTSNKVNDKTIYYYRNKPNLSTANFTQNGTPGQILLDTCINAVIQDFSFTNVSSAIQGSYSDDLLIKNVTIVNTTEHALWLYDCYRVNLTDNHFAENEGFGLYASNCYNSFFSKNSVNNSYGGLQLVLCDDSNVSENEVFSVQYHGISNYLSDNMSITDNFVNNSEEDGIVVYIGGNGIQTQTGLLRNNTVQSCLDCGILLSAADRLVVTNNSVKNNRVNIKLNQSIYDADESIVESLNCSIIENIIEDGDIGIEIIYGLQSNISANQIRDCTTGIKITESPDSFISANRLSNCDIDFGNDFSALLSLNITLTNTIDGKNIYIHKNTTNIDFDDVNFLGAASRVILVQCNDSFIANLNLDSRAIYGILLYECRNITIASATISNVIKGIYVASGANISLQSNVLSNLGGSGITISGVGEGLQIIGNQIINVGTSRVGSLFGIGSGIYGDGVNATVQGNVIRHCPQEGIRLDSPESLLNNIIEDCQTGIIVFYKDNVSIIGNTVEYCEFGMQVAFLIGSILIKNNLFLKNQIGLHIGEAPSCTNFTIIENQFIENTQTGMVFNQVSNVMVFKNTFLNNLKGIQIDGASSNLLYYNNFTGNQIHATDNGGYNLWDNGSIGNYWDDYTGIDNDHDGIGDTPYSVPGTANAVDHFPIYVPKPSNPSNDPLVNILIGLLIAVGILVLGFVIKNARNQSSKTKDEEPLDAVFEDESSRETNTYSKIKEYLKTDKSIDEMPEIQHLLTSLAGLEIMQKFAQLNFSDEEKRMLAMDLVSLSPKERNKLLDEILKHQN